MSDGHRHTEMKLWPVNLKGCNCTYCFLQPATATLHYPMLCRCGQQGVFCIGHGGADWDVTWNSQIIVDYQRGHDKAESEDTLEAFLGRR